MDLVFFFLTFGQFVSGQERWIFGTSKKYMPEYPMDKTDLRSKTMILIRFLIEPGIFFQFERIDKEITIN